MSEISFKSPVDVGPLTSPDGSVTVADAASTTKVQVRAAADTAAAAALGVPYGRSQRRPDGHSGLATASGSSPAGQT